ncbi:hypothetical protein [Polynucleobacter sp. AP-Nickl1-40-C4]|uniref:hypothetical protein n=1 Tax=Polynucleobacter sp. AP-Nickl1-40-C4 TaxID=3108275 RepID=UPI002B22BE5D|nr:hypothetical protein [Polynucleobacter sp. AP-Nickl1-40-C4]MEA9567539.1 hypothetical protein [Polynucleobacter sp. AP-Nickl1-40-C4]
MTKPKKTPEPEVIAIYKDDQQMTEVVEINEHTENKGKGAALKVWRFKNFNKAFGLIAAKYFFGHPSLKETKTIRQCIREPRKISMLTKHFERMGVYLSDRAARNLAIEIQKHIKLLESAHEEAKN